MSREVAFAAVKFVMENSGRGMSGLLFYGGEPLLEKNLIYDMVDYTQALKKKKGHNFYYKMTTNGTLLDEEFLKFSEKVNLGIGFSHDGHAQDDCRVFSDGAGSYTKLKDIIPLLLKYQPYAIGMSVIDPSTVHKASSIVGFLFEKGFRYITVGVNYCKTAPWTKNNLSTLENEYKKMAEMYIKWTKAEEKFYLSSFDMKILSHIKGEKYNSDRSRMNINQPSVAPDGKIYYASMHLGNPAFEIGDVFSGIDSEKQKTISAKGAIPSETCQKCALRPRCNYAYDNLIYHDSEYITNISPVQCVHEQLITPIADYTAENLYKDNNALFIHKHYNELYSFVSLVEDRNSIKIG